MKLRIQAGFVTDFTDIGAEGFWKDGNLVRFRNGLPESVGATKPALNNSGNPIEYRGVCRSLHDWADLEGVQWLAIGTSKKLYLYSASVLYDVTPERASTVLTNPFTTSLTGAYDPEELGDATYVLVADVGHGARLGDVVTFSGASAAGGVTIDGDYEIIEIVSIDSYTIRSTVAATSTATGGGTVTATYDVNGGLDAGFVLPGYGSGNYGSGPYGQTDASAPTTAGFNPGARIWALDNWGEDLLAAPSDGTLYWWDRTNNGATKAQVVANAPNRMQWFLVSAQYRHAIAFGASIGATDERDPLLIRWSDSEDFTVWTDDEDNVAGETRLDDGSEIVTAVKSRSQFLVWTDKSLHRFFYVGDPFFWTSDPIATNVRIAGPNAAVTAGSKTYWMGVDKFYVYDGVHVEMQCPVWDVVFKDFNRDQSDQVTAHINEQFSEVRWDYPSVNSNENDRYVVYNYSQRIWYYGQEDRTFMNEASPLFNLVYGARGGYGNSDDNKGSIYLHDTTSDTPDNPVRRFIESGDFMLDEGGVVAYLRRLFPNFAELSGHVDISVYVKDTPQDRAYKRKKFRDVTSRTEFISPSLRGRQMFLRIESRFDKNSWRLGVPVIEVVPDGER